MYSLKLAYENPESVKEEEQKIQHGFVIFVLLFICQPVPFLCHVKIHTNKVKTNSPSLDKVN